MTQGLRWPIAIAVAGGLAAAVWAIGKVGLGELVDAALRLGIEGFLLFCAGSIGLLVLLGAAWWVAMPPVRARALPLFAWARAAREGSNDLLPFSQIGGLLIGARTLTGAGLPPTRVYAAMIVDLTTEMAGQLVVVLFGLWALGSMLLHGQGEALSPAAWTGAAMAVAILAAFVTLQRPLLSFLDTVGTKMLPRADLPLGRIRAELDTLYADRRPVAASFLLNIAAWLGTAVLAWVGLRLMGVEAPLVRVVAVESLISVVRSAAFLIPGALGVQEAAYLLLAQAFGIDPQAMLALSLVKRARDVAIGLPTLLLWWASDLRRRPQAA
jgi:putative membrane protein